MDALMDRDSHFVAPTAGVRVVTPEQYTEGFKVFLPQGAVLFSGLRFALIRQLDDGNYLVRDPDSEVVTEGERCRIPRFGLSWEA